MSNTKQLLSSGEEFIIVKHFDPLQNKLVDANINLSKTDAVTLRTNGEVIYGIYKENGKTIKFTHNPKYDLPFINDKDYMQYKGIVRQCWREAFHSEAKAKFAAVQAKMNELLNKANTNNNTNKKEVKEMNNTNQVPQAPVVTETQTKEVTKEVNVTITSDMSVMAIAHLIRRELKLEGHYHVQMKIAMSYAWQVKKEEITIESLNIKATDVKSEVKAINTSVKATNTYNAEEDFEKVEKYFVDRATKMCSDNDIFPTDAGFIIMETKNMVVKAIEQQDTTNMSARDLTIAIRKDIFNKISQLVTEQVELDAIAEAKEKAAQDLAIEAQMRAEEEARRLAQQCDVVETVEAVAPQYQVYLHSINNGMADIKCKFPNGQTKTVFRLAANNLIAFDRAFITPNASGKSPLEMLLNQAPNNTELLYYGDFTHMAFMNNDAYRALAKKKNITLKLGVAPSGDAA